MIRPGYEGIVIAWSMLAVALVLIGLVKLPF